MANWQAAFGPERRNIKSLRQARANLLHEMKSLQQKLGMSSLSAEDRAAAKTRFQQAEAEWEDNEKHLAAAEVEAEDERRTAGGVDPDHQAAQRAAALAGIHTDGRAFTSRRSGPDAGLTFRALHGNVAASTDGWAHAGEIFSVLGSGLNDGRLRAAGQGGNADAIGGYALPVATEIAIFDGAVGPSIFLPRANVQPMTTRQQDIATFDRSNDGADGTMFGLSFEFVAEGGAGASIQTASLRMISMNAHTAAILFDASNEQLQDAGGFESGLLKAVSLASAYGIDRFCLNGTGAGQPLGVKNQPSLITVSKESGQGADTILYENLVAMFSRLPGSSVQSSVWLASQSCIPQLATLSVAIGTAGSHVPVMTESDGQFKILTRPVIFTDLCRPVGDAGDIMLLDLSQYTIGMRQGMGVERSIHVGFSKNRTTFRLLLRFDGGSGWDQPFQPEFSAPTQSPFIQLAERA